MSNREEPQMVDQDNSTDQQDEQSGIDHGMLGKEQMLLRAERQGDQYEDGQDNQGTLSEQEVPQEMMNVEEPGMQPPDEVGTLPEKRGELIDPAMEPVDQEALDRLPTDQPEREVIPATFDSTN